MAPLCCVGSVSLLGKPPDSTVMTVPTGKNLDAIPRKVGSDIGHNLDDYATTIVLLDLEKQLPIRLNDQFILVLCWSLLRLIFCLVSSDRDHTCLACLTYFALLKQTQNYFLGCFLLKFGLTVCAYLLAFGFTLQEVFCRSSNITVVDNTTCLHILKAR